MSATFLDIAMQPGERLWQDENMVRLPNRLHGLLVDVARQCSRLRREADAFSRQANAVVDGQPAKTMLVEAAKLHRDMADRLEAMLLKHRGAVRVLFGHGNVAAIADDPKFKDVEWDAHEEVTRA